jgi:hypothetical protein
MLRCLMVGLLFTAPLPAAAQLRDMGQERLAADPGYRLFLLDLQRAVRTHDRERVLQLISYPLRVNDSARDESNPARRTYRNAAAVRANYRRIFTPAIRRDILTQRYERVWGNSYGMVIGLGAVWFDRTCPNNRCQPPGPVRIFVVNLAPARLSR